MPLTPDFSTSEDFARHLDSRDPLAHFRDRFFHPRRPDGRPIIYFCGHSLGLLPKTARDDVIHELDSWAEHGVEGHFHGDAPWYTYPELFRDSAARLVGARRDEVVFMNGLTVNLHLMLASFYNPNQQRHKIVIDSPTFPSDRYAIATHIRHRGFDPKTSIVVAEARPGEHLLREDDIEATLEKHGDSVSIVLLAAVNFLTGQFFDIARIAEAVHRRGAKLGLDLAHAAGNVPLQLHEWGVDFAVWCSYKYLNAGPGGVGGCFVHHRHAVDPQRPILAGWWGNDPATRFRMQLEPNFIPKEGADGWQVSNPPILALAPLRASLRLFDEATMPALRRKSELLGGYMLDLLETFPRSHCQLITPREPARRGAQISLRIPDRPREVQAALQEAGVVCDFREPDIIRAAPVPLYNTFHEVWSFVQKLA